MQTVIAEPREDKHAPRILGVGVAPSAGMRRGIIVDVEDAKDAIRFSFAEAQKNAGVTLRSVWVGLEGIGASVSSSKGIVAVSRADGEIVPEDVRRAIAAAETFMPRAQNKEILHLIPREFRVDQESGVSDPVGMHGVRLEADTLIIEYPAALLKNVLKCVEEAGARVENYVFSPLASAEILLSRRQKELGVMVLDIGGGTASFIVFDEGFPLHAGVLPIGGTQITNDLAIGLRTHVDIAERIKCVYGSCLPESFGKKEVIKLAEFIPQETALVARRELAEMVEARLGDIFELLQKELKKVNRKQLLPGGVILTGGSSLIPGLVELTKRELGLPVELGTVSLQEGYGVDSDMFPFLTTAFGIVAWADASLKGSVRGSLYDRARYFTSSNVMRWLKSFLP
ncbi:MAG: Cell division protein ftsA [Parcubacteria group bacterium Gr01-1014_66]|nr:MAG: Cell division protein ftsA [Parcubacteria group bacterium Gr01-1014_66]